MKVETVAGPQITVNSTAFAAGWVLRPSVLRKGHIVIQKKAFFLLTSLPEVNAMVMSMARSLVSN